MGARLEPNPPSEPLRGRGPEPSGWNDPARAEEYLDRRDRLAPRAAGEAAVVEVLPPAPERVLDLGCGDGRLTSLVLERRPSVQTVTAVDISPPMLARARQRFADDARVHIVERDLRAPIRGLGGFDVVVSGFAIHHLEDSRKQTLLREVAHQLRAGGRFANLEVVQSATPALHATFRRLIGRETDDPEDRLAPVEAQLSWMRRAGLEEVDCLWRWRGFALLVGEAGWPTRRGAPVGRAVDRARLPCEVPPSERVPAAWCAELAEILRSGDAR